MRPLNRAGVGRARLAESRGLRSRSYAAVVLAPLAALAPMVFSLPAAGAATVGPGPAQGRAPAPVFAPTGSGCGVAAHSGSTTLALQVAGHRRTVIVHLPPNYHSSRRHALVLNLHGSGSTAKGQELFSGMDATSDTDFFIVAYPQGLIPSGNGFDWDVPGVPLFGGSYPPKGSANDVAFLTDLVPALESRYCIDPKRVFVTGMSGGGRMASQLACDSSSTFAAAAPVAGLRLPTPCPTARAVPIVAFHGTADPVDPYNGHGQAYWTYSVPTAASRWASQDKCSSHAGTSHHAGYALTAYSGCAGGASVELYSVTGEGHEWPGGPVMPRAITRLLGAQSSAVSANNIMWAFFTRHPMP